MRARGANALLRAYFETVYGTPPTANFMSLPFVKSSLGEEQNLLESDLLGLGREGTDPTLDVINNDGNLTVPVDVRAFGYWLTLYLGEPDTTTSGSAAGDITFSAQPAVNSIITINGTAFTFKASGATGNQIDLGATLSDTLDATATALNGSAVSGVAQATYSKGGTTKLHVSYDTAGTAGNAFTLAVGTGSNGTPSGPTLTGGGYSHVFTSGAEELPSLSAEVGNPEVPVYEMNFGVRGNTMQIGLARSGLLNCDLGLIAQGSNLLDASGAGTPTNIAIDRFAQAMGQIKKDGAQLASIVSASMSFSNNLDKVEVIRPDGRIDDADPGMSKASGNITSRFADRSLLDLAGAGTPIELSYGWTKDGWSLVFDMPRIFLPRPKRSIDGPNGIQASFDWQASGADSNSMTVTLINDVASYALP